MLLINPASEQFGGILSRYVPVGIPVPVGTLAAWMMKHGHTVAVADDELGKIDEAKVRDLVKDLPKPYVIGLSVLAAQSARAYQINRMLKRMYPDCITIAGGIHVTAVPEEPLRNGIDFVIRGEGEVPLLRLYEAIREGKSWKNINSLSFLKPDGTFWSNPDGPLIENLDDIPIFPYELFKHPKYDYGFTTSSRGCPYKCSYCSQRLMTGLTYRFKSPERMVQELSILINDYNQKHIVFYDDNFAFKKRRVVELADAIRNAGLHTKCGFFVQTRADNFYEDIIPDMKRANFTGVGFGMETGVERLAQVTVKGQTVETHKKSIALARKHGIDVSVFMIFGLPTETHEDRMASYRLVKELGIKFTKFNNLIPYPGTKLFNDVKASGRMNVQPAWKNFNSTLTATRSIFDTTPLPYIPEGTTEWELKRDIFHCNMSWYFRPQMIIDVLKRKPGPGFVMLPPKWWTKPREIYEVAKLGLTMFSNYAITLLPKSVGGVIYYTVTRALRWARGESYPEYQLPDTVIDGTMRKIVVAKKGQILTGTEVAGEVVAPSGVISAPAKLTSVLTEVAQPGVLSSPSAAGTA